MEQPTFNEAAVFGGTPTKAPRSVFSREEALQYAPDHLKETFRELFAQIDRLDLIINYYDLEHGKRKKEPRAELLDRFDFNAAAELHRIALDLPQYKYLKLRHELVELRKQQYTLRDSYAQPMQRAMPQFYFREEMPEFEYNVDIFPLGIDMPGTFMELFFREEQQLTPKNYSEEELRVVLEYYWKKKDAEEKHNFRYVDLRDPEHLALVFEFLGELEAQDENVATEALIRTIWYYVDFAELSVMHREILDLKIHKHTNQQIQQIINEKYGKSYTVNYISTIFRQQVIPAITEAVEYHCRIIENLCFEENFKVCICCGRTLLCDPHNFVRRGRSKDGFNSKCKACEKKSRRK